jgi:hypothetical protein
VDSEAADEEVLNKVHQKSSPKTVVKERIPSGVEKHYCVAIASVRDPDPEADPDP